MGLLVDKVALGQDFLRGISLSPVNIIPPWLSIPIIIRVMNNRPVGGHSSETYPAPSTWQYEKHFVVICFLGWFALSRGLVLKHSFALLLMLVGVFYNVWQLLSSFWGARGTMVLGKGCFSHNGYLQIRPVLDFCCRRTRVAQPGDRVIDIAPCLRGALLHSLPI
jgi:hypothetical protein